MIYILEFPLNFLILNLIYILESFQRREWQNAGKTIFINHKYTLGNILYGTRLTKIIQYYSYDFLCSMFVYLYK